MNIVMRRVFVILTVVSLALSLLAADSAPRRRAAAPVDPAPKVTYAANQVEAYASANDIAFIRPRSEGHRQLHHHRFRPPPGR